MTTAKFRISDLEDNAEKILLDAAGIRRDETRDSEQWRVGGSVCGPLTLQERAGTASRRHVPGVSQTEERHGCHAGRPRWQAGLETRTPEPSTAGVRGRLDGSQRAWDKGQQQVPGCGDTSPSKCTVKSDWPPQLRLYNQPHFFFRNICKAHSPRSLLKEPQTHDGK